MLGVLSVKHNTMWRTALLLLMFTLHVGMFWFFSPAVCKAIEILSLHFSVLCLCSRVP